MNIKAMLRAHFAPREDDNYFAEPIEPTINNQHYGELTMTSQTRSAAAKMMEALQTETDLLLQDAIAEIEFCTNTIANFTEASERECAQIDAETEQRKAATRRMYEELIGIERRRIANARRRVEIIDGTEPQQQQPASDA